MVMCRFLVVAPLLLLCAQAAFGDGMDPKTATLHVEKTGKFQVLVSRVETSGTSTVLFGLIGAAVTSSVENNKDTARENELLPLIGDPSCEKVFRTSLANRLAEKGHTLAGEAQDSGPQIHLKIEACGFRIVDRETGEIAAFFAADYRLYDEPVSKARDLERLLLTGRNRYAWADLLDNPETVADEFRSIQSKAGRRIANKLIYSNR